MSDNNNKQTLNQQEDKLLLNHEYDGIQEFNYPLPGWWKATFYITSIFGIGYIIYYIFMHGPSLKHEYFVDEKSVMETRDRYLEELKNFNADTYQTVALSQDMLSVGEATFKSNCIMCHKEKGAGDIGPNLTDNFWLLSNGTPAEIYPFIIGGNPINGMPAWGGILSEEELYAVTAYIASLRGAKVPDPKEPQGDEYDTEGNPVTENNNAATATE